MILVNGEASDRVAVDDRGLGYGDGVFETLRARRGRLPLLGYHLDRLFAGLSALGIPHPERRPLKDELWRAAAEEPCGVVKLTVTRGSGGRGYAAPARVTVTRIVQNFPLPEFVSDWQERGVRVMFCKTPLEGPRALAGLKHLNRLPQVLAQREVDSQDYDEGLMRNSGGQLVEGIRTNLFVRVREHLMTPPTGAGVEGVMRRLVMELAEGAGIEVVERHISDAEFNVAEEIFVTNAIAGVCPVRQVEDRTLGIGTMTRLLQSNVENELERRTC